MSYSYVPSYVSVTPQHRYGYTYATSSYYDGYAPIYNVYKGVYAYGEGTSLTGSGLAYNPSAVGSAGGTSAIGGLLSGIGNGVGNALSNAGIPRPQILQQAPATAGLVTLLVIAAVVVAVAHHR